MRRVVAFMGGSRDTVATLQRTLPSSLGWLAAAGILVPTSGRSAEKANGFSHQPLAGGNATRWAAVEGEVRAQEHETVFLFMPGLLRLGGSAPKRVEILSRLSALGDDICVVSVVGDQLTLINEYYLNQVALWRISKRLEPAAPRLFDNDLFVHERLLRPWYAESSARYAAVPLNEFTRGHPVAAVLQAAGVDLANDPPSSGVAPPPKLGSVGVEANRLLSTYLRAEIPGFKADDDGVATASRAALARADKLGWCTERFWGWTRRAAEKAVARFDESNRRFAQAVWGTDWTIGYPLKRTCTQVDFLDLDVQVIDQVQRYVLAVAEKVSQDRPAPR